MKSSMAFALLCVGALACGSGGDPGPGDPGSLAGTWTGSWLSHDGIGGSATLDLTDSGSSLTGNVAFTNSPCFTNGDISATLNGSNFSATVTAGGIEVTLSGTLSGGQISGTYDAVSAGACTGDTGTFSASM
jgi:hypothetical protein